MTIKPFYKVFAALLMSVTMVGANANSVGFDLDSYDASSGSFSVTINYDFTDFNMFGGGMDLAFDASVLSLVSYTRSDPADRPGSQDPASPVGSLASAGLYEGFGVGTFDFFTGFGGTGTVGTFVFDVIGTASRGDSALMLMPNAINVFASIDIQPGQMTTDVTNLIFPTGAISSTVTGLAPIPVPAAIWFMLSGVGALMGLRRRS